MKNLIGYVVVGLIFCSCADHSKNEMVAYRAAEESLSKANENIAHHTLDLYRSLEEKLYNPDEKYYAKMWQPKAAFIRERTSVVTKYIEELEDNLRSGAGITVANAHEVLQKYNTAAVTDLFTNKRKGEELYGKLKRYNSEVLDFEPEIQNIFGKDSMSMFKEIEPGTDDQENFTTTYFKDIPVVAALSMLSTFENEVRVLENELVTFCFNQIGHTDGGGFFTKLGCLIGQSSNKLNPGDQLEITAGIGAFSIAANPKITINGKNISLGDGASATYKFKVPANAGKYSVPVKIEFTTENGTKELFTKKIEYTVAE